jgi:hypothetical protein
VREEPSSYKPLEWFLQVLCFLWFLTLLLGWLERDILHLPSKDWYPFFLPHARFSDFTIFSERFKFFERGDFFHFQGFPFTYPAPVAIAYELFYRFGQYSLYAYILFCFLTFLVAGVALGRAMRQLRLAIPGVGLFIGSTILLSDPFWFLLDRGNIEMVNWLLIALGVTAYWNKKWHVAAFLFGVAISFKIFPFVFLGLLLSARKYLAVASGIVTAALTTVAATWYIGPTYETASTGIASGLEFFRTHYILEVHPNEIGFDHSAFAFVKLVALANDVTQGLSLVPWLNRYMVITAVSGLILYFWKIRTLPRANQVLALTVASILLPPVSGDYTLVHLYIPWGVLVLLTASKDKRNVKGLVFTFICMAFLMAPESFVIIDGMRFAGQLKAIVLLALFIVSITCPFEETEAVIDKSKPLLS